MSLLAEYDAASPALFLGPTLEAFPDLEIDLERQFALDPDQPIAFCWIRGLPFDEIERTLTRDETVSAFERFEVVNDRGLYRIRRSRSGENVLDAYSHWVAAGGELLECRGNHGRWEIRMRFPDRDAFATYHEFLEAGNVSFTLHRLSNGSTGDHDDIVTSQQLEALQVAYETGFFDVPRGATLTDIADELGISDQAVSERLRRGQGRLVEQYIL